MMVTWALDAMALRSSCDRSGGKRQKLRPRREQRPERSAPAVAGAGLEHRRHAAVQGFQQRRVILLAEAVPEGADEPVQRQLQRERAQLAAVGGVAQDGAGGGARAEQAADGAADGGDLDLTGGVADEVDAG